MVKGVVLQGGAPWGFRLGGGERDDQPIVIAKLNPNSKAHQNGLTVGDRVTSINGHDCTSLYLNDAQQLIKQATQQLLIEVEKDDQRIPNGDVKHLSSTTISLRSREIPVTNVTSQDFYEDPVSPNSPSYQVYSVPILTHPEDNEIAEFSNNLLTTLEPSTSDQSYTRGSPNLLKPASPRPGVWSPGTQPNKLPSEMVEKRHNEPAISNKSPAVWSPSNSFGPSKKEFRPVKLDTHLPKKVVINKQPQKQEEIPVDNHQFREPEAPHSHKTTADFRYHPMDVDSHPSLHNGHLEDSGLPSTQSPYVTLLQKSRGGEIPKGVQYLGYTNTTDQDITTSSQTISDVPRPDTRHPIPVQSEPTSSKTVSDVTRPDTYHPIPVNMDTTVGEVTHNDTYYTTPTQRETIETIDGNVKHTDTYYSIPVRGETTSTKTIVEQAGKIRDGIGPVDDEGVPLAFRKDVDEKNQHDWYKQMYRSLHRHGRKASIDSFLEEYKPTYEFPDEPRYQKMDTKKEDLTRLYDETKKANEMKKSNERPHYGPIKVVPNKDKDTKYKWSSADVRHGNEPYKIQPRSIVDYEPGFSSIAFNEARTDVTLNPPIPKPGQFSQYTIGQAKPQSHTQRQLQNQNNDDDPGVSYKNMQRGGDIPVRGFQKFSQDKRASEKKNNSQSPTADPPTKSSTTTQDITSPPHDTSVDNVIETVRQSSPAKIRSVPSHNKNSHDSSKRVSNDGYSNTSPETVKFNGYGNDKHIDINANDNRETSRETVIQNGRHSPILMNGGYPYSSSELQRNQINAEKQRQRREEDYAYRMKRLDEIFEDERKRKNQEDQAKADMRRHHDYFTPAQKSPIPSNRFDTVDANKPSNQQTSPNLRDPHMSPRDRQMSGDPQTNAGLLSVPADRRRGFQIKGKARAIYNFMAQNPNELTFRKGGKQDTYLPSSSEYRDRFETNRGSLPESMTRSFSQPGQQQSQAKWDGLGGSRFDKPAPAKTKVADDDLALTRYRALYTYHRQNEDELEMLEGDEVYVMEKCDDGWFVGTSARTGDFGTFPGNYVHIIT